MQEFCQSLCTKIKKIKYNNRKLTVSYLVFYFILFYFILFYFVAAFAQLQ